MKMGKRKGKSRKSKSKPRKGLSRKAKLAISGVKVGRAFAKLGASKQAKRKYDQKSNALIKGIKESDRTQKARKQQSKNKGKTTIHLKRKGVKIKIKKGALSKKLGIPEAKNIPKTLLLTIKKAKAGTTIKNPTKAGKRTIKVTSKTKKQANLALTLKGFKKK